jgi:hypothetical protein
MHYVRDKEKDDNMTVRVGDDGCLQTYDPEGKKYKAIFLNASARWCTACRGEQDTIRYRKKMWGDKGGVFLETIFENLAQEPAEPLDLKYWGKNNNITWTLLLDPSNKLSQMFDITATPMNAVIDPRTMKIVAVVTGAPNSTWWDTNMKPLIEGTNQ